ncbi:MAG TPA: type III pantothenate kinase [Planctomycetota bacterium]|nr:type III pantothenate kinase [Planctomycetota bacterium]
MLLALDLGNSSLSAGVFDGRELVRRFRILVADFDVLAARLQEHLAGLPQGEIDRVALASVNPPRVDTVRESVAAALHGVELVMVGRDVRVPVEARVDRPGEVGTDRLLNVLAAFRRLGDACLVADFGTALTIDVVSVDGAYVGGVIAPGITMSASALHAGTALLPRVVLRPVDNVIGTDTVGCIQSGLFWGTIGMLEGLVRRLREEYPAARKVLGTGGDAALFADHCDVIDEVVPELTLEGIRLTVEEGAER